MTRSAFVFASLALALCGFAQAPPNSAPQVPARSVPAQLAGKGLAQHDFMYTGESHDRCIFIVRHGEIVWTYDDPAGKGEISDAVMLSNGNILFAHQFGVGVITPDKKIVWNYDAPAGKEIHTAVPIGTDHSILIPCFRPDLYQLFWPRRPNAGAWSGSPLPHMHTSLHRRCKR